MRIEMWGALIVISVAVAMLAIYRNRGKSMSKFIRDEVKLLNAGLPLVFQWTRFLIIAAFLVAAALAIIGFIAFLAS